MQCDLQAVSDGEGQLHLRFGTNGADWLHYVWCGQRVWLCTATGRRRVSVRLALKLLVREVWLRELWLRDLAVVESGGDQRGKAATSNAALPELQP